MSALSAQLTPSEREALQKAVSAAYLEERGLREGSHGEIVNEYGRTIFEVGFASATRKILESQAQIIAKIYLTSTNHLQHI